MGSLPNHGDARSGRRIRRPAAKCCKLQAIKERAFQGRFLWLCAVKVNKFIGKVLPSRQLCCIIGCENPYQLVPVGAEFVQSSQPSWNGYVLEKGKHYGRNPLQKEKTKGSSKGLAVLRGHTLGLFLRDSLQGRFRPIRAGLSTFQPNKL